MTPGNTPAFTITTFDSAPTSRSSDSTVVASSVSAPPAPAFGVYVANNHVRGQRQSRRSRIVGASRINISWSYPVLVMFIKQIMKPNHQSLVRTPNTQLKREIWETMLEKFKTLLQENPFTRHMSTDRLTIRKMQDKWMEIKTKYYKLKPSVSAAGCGEGGNERWPYYSMVHDVLCDDHYEDSGVNIESMGPGNGITIELPSRQQAFPDWLHQEIDESSTADAAEAADVNTTIGASSVTNDNTRSDDGISRRRPRDPDDQYEIMHDILDRFERINARNLDLFRESSERMVEIVRQKGEMALEMQREQHRYYMETFQASLNAITAVANYHKESNARWMTILETYFNLSNGRRSGDDTSNNTQS